MLITLVILWGTALAFYRHGGTGKLDRIYGLSQFLLIGIAYAAINLGNLYINLTGPVMFGFLYFSVARFYSFTTARALDESVVARLRPGTAGAWGYLLALRFDLHTREDAALARLGRLLRSRCTHHPSIESLNGRQKGLWRLFENTLVLCWFAERGEEARREAIREEAARMLRDLPEILRHEGLATALPVERLLTAQAEGTLGGTDSLDWRALLGAALLREGRQWPDPSAQVPPRHDNTTGDPL